MLDLISQGMKEPTLEVVIGSPPYLDALLLRTPRRNERPSPYFKAMVNRISLLMRPFVGLRLKNSNMVPTEGLL